MNELVIYKGCTNPIFVQLLNEDGTVREYDSSDTVIFALSPDRKKANVIINKFMNYDSDEGMYYLMITPEMTENLIGDERYYYDIKCVTNDGTFPVQPITPVWVVPDLSDSEVQND